METFVFSYRISHNTKMTTINVTVVMLIHINTRPIVIACSYFPNTSINQTQLSNQPTNQLDEWTITVIPYSELGYWEIRRHISINFFVFSSFFHFVYLFFGHVDNFSSSLPSWNFIWHGTTYGMAWHVISIDWIKSN